jgi:Fe-S cluster assembly protein SufD
MSLVASFGDERMESLRYWYQDIFSQAVGTHNSSARAAEFNKFLEHGWPRAGLEEWKYTSFDRVLQRQLGIAPELKSDPSLLGRYEIQSQEFEGSIVFLNGRFCEGLSVLPTNVQVVVSDRSNVVNLPSERLQSLGWLNSACADEVVHICIGKNMACEKPVQLVYISDGSDTAAVTFPNVVIVAEQSSQSTVVEQYVGCGDYFTCGVTQAFVRQNARLSHIKVQRESSSSYHWHDLILDVAADGHCTAATYALGGELVRNEVHATLAGSGGTLELYGLSLGGGDRHIDNSTIIDHAVPNCESREIYKGIYGDVASGAFSGTIIVRPGAQKTNAIQSNQGLLLSDKAEFNSRPQLKIWADDVKCTHGATVGQLDEDALFYLRARGIPLQKARAILTQAFAQEAIGILTVDSLHSLVQRGLETGLDEIWSRSALSGE